MQIVYIYIYTYCLLPIFWKVENLFKFSRNRLYFMLASNRLKEHGEEQRPATVSGENIAATAGASLECTLDVA